MYSLVLTDLLLMMILVDLGLLSAIVKFLDLTLYTIIALLTPLKYHVFENIMKN